MIVPIAFLYAPIFSINRPSVGSVKSRRDIRNSPCLTLCGQNWTFSHWKLRMKDVRPSLKQAIRHYDQALNGTNWENGSQISKNLITLRQALAVLRLWENGSQISKNLITLRQALAVLHLKDRSLFKDAREQVKKMEEWLKEGDPPSSEDEREEYSLCLFNLAHWYANQAKYYNKRKNKAKEAKYRNEARKSLIYSFVRDPGRLYNEEQEGERRRAFQRFFDTEHLFKSDGEALWKFLEKKENQPKVRDKQSCRGKIL